MPDQQQKQRVFQGRTVSPDEISQHKKHVGQTDDREAIHMW